MYTEDIEGYTILIGRSKDENDMLYEMLYEKSRDSDKPVLWFHLTDGPSPHGFLVGAKPPKSLIYKTSLLIKKFSKMKKENNVEVDYIDLQYVTKTDEKGTFELLKTPKVIKV